MALRKYYLGSVGPLVFDDSEPVNDLDGDFTGLTFQSFLANFQGHITVPPAVANEILRFQDIAAGVGLPVATKTGNYTLLDSYGLWRRSARGKILF